MNKSDDLIGPFGRSFVGDFPTSGTMLILLSTFFISALFSLGNIIPFLILFIISSSSVVYISYNFIEPHFNSKLSVNLLSFKKNRLSYDFLRETFTSGSERPKKIISFTDAIKNFFKNWANFRGRASRSEYNWPLLFLFLLQIIFTIISIVLLLFLSLSEGSDFVFFIFFSINLIFQIIFFLFFIFIIIPSITILIRRLHDIGYSGWYYLSYFLITLIIQFICYFISEYLFIFSYVIFSIPLYLIMILPGENKTNRFGTIPKNELNYQIESFTPVEIWDFSDSKFYNSFSKDIFANNKNNRILIPELRMKVIFQSLGLFLSIFVLNLVFTFLIIGIIVVFDINQIDLLGLSMGLIYYLMTFLILLIFLSFDKERNYFWKLFSLQRPFYSFILMILILILDFLLIFVAYDFLYELLMPSLVEEDLFYDSSSSNDPLILLLLFISLSIAAPIFEEMVFRGYILQKLRKSFSDIFSILLSGILFGIAHWSIFAPFDLYQTGAATIGGFLYGWLTIRTESIWPSIIAHSLWNGGIFLLMLIYVF